MTVQERLLAGVINVNDCWCWRGYKDKDGYGVIKVKGEARHIHRVSYEAFVAPIPKKMTVDHICWNRACCNPAHLQILSHIENARKQRSVVALKCINGHLRDVDNMYIQPNTGGRKRYCRACNLEAVKRYQERAYIGDRP